MNSNGEHLIMKKAMITGASRGIGHAIAERLRGEYELYLICRNNIDMMADIAEASANPVHMYMGDAGDSDFIRKVFSDVSSLDLLINNAGTAYYGLVQDMEDSDWDSIIATDLTSVFNTSRSAARLMVQSHSGRIINISSQWGGTGASCEAAYSAAKGGVDAFTKALAKELAPSGIAVNAVAPGVVDTDMNRHLSEEEMKVLIEEIPAGRMCTPEEVAEAVYLLSKMPLYLTGQIISINGGW